MDKSLWESKTMWAAALLFLAGVYQAWNGSYEQGVELLGQAGGLFGLRSAMR